jgi:hypothetical protein
MNVRAFAALSLAASLTGVLLAAGPTGAGDQPEKITSSDKSAATEATSPPDHAARANPPGPTDPKARPEQKSRPDASSWGDLAGWGDDGGPPDGGGFQGRRMPGNGGGPDGGMGPGGPMRGRGGFDRGGPPDGRGFGRPTTRPVVVLPGTYAILMTRSIFARGGVAAQGPAGSNGSESSDGAEGQGGPDSSLALRGISYENSKYLAFVENTATHRTLRLGPGDSVGDGRLTGFTLDSVEYEFGGDHRRIMVGENFLGAVIPPTTQPATQTAPPPGMPGGPGGPGGPFFPTTMPGGATWTPGMQPPWAGMTGMPSRRGRGGGGRRNRNGN